MRIFILTLTLSLLFTNCDVNKKIIKSPCFDQFLTIGFPDVIKKQLPEKVLPHRKITENLVIQTTNIDTVRKDYIYKTLENPQVIIFKMNKNDFDQYVAIERDSDWVIINWSIFKQAAPAGLDFEWIKFKNEKTPFLLATSDRQMFQKAGGSRSYVNNVLYGNSQHFKRAKGYCLIDPINLELLLDNIYIGYDYSYSKWENFREPIANNPKNYYYGTKNSIEYTRSLWYDFKFDLKGDKIVVKKILSEDKITRNESLKYNSEEQNKIKGIKRPDMITICEQNDCYPILNEGVYKLKHNCFIIE